MNFNQFLQTHFLSIEYLSFWKNWRSISGENGLLFTYVSEEAYFACKDHKLLHAVVCDRKALVVEIKVGLNDLTVSRLCSKILVLFTGFLLNTIIL